MGRCEANARRAATHKHPNVRRWLDRHSRVHVHFTPTSSSWLNMVERFFRDLTTKRLRRGVFTSVQDLELALHAYVRVHNVNPKPFIWTKTATDILQKVTRSLSLCDGPVNLHIACYNDEHCAARRISDESFLRSFTDDPDLKRLAFSFTAPLVRKHIGFALMAPLRSSAAENLRQHG